MILLMSVNTTMSLTWDWFRNFLMSHKSMFVKLYHVYSLKISHNGDRSTSALYVYVEPQRLEMLLRSDCREMIIS